MATYRVTCMVTTEVEGEDTSQATENALNKIRNLVGDNPNAPTGSERREAWVTGIAQDGNGYLIFEQNHHSN